MTCLRYNLQTIYGKLIIGITGCEHGHDSRKRLAAIKTSQCLA